MPPEPLRWCQRSTPGGEVPRRGHCQQQTSRGGEASSPRGGRGLGAEAECPGPMCLRTGWWLQAGGRWCSPPLDTVLRPGRAPDRQVTDCGCFQETQPGLPAAAPCGCPAALSLLHPLLSLFPGSRSLARCSVSQVGLPGSAQPSEPEPWSVRSDVQVPALSYVMRRS